MPGEQSTSRAKSHTEIAIEKAGKPVKCKIKIILPAVVGRWEPCCFRRLYNRHYRVSGKK
jgi:hypothetical protein